MRNLRWVLNTLAKFRLDTITQLYLRIEYVYLFEKGETISSLLKLTIN